MKRFILPQRNSSGPLLLVLCRLSVETGYVCAVAHRRAARLATAAGGLTATCAWFDAQISICRAISITCSGAKLNRSTTLTELR